MLISLKRLGKKPFYTVCGEDGEPIGLADRETVSLLSLSDGCDADPDTLAAAVADSELRIARSHAYYLLSLRDRSSAELMQKLLELPLSEQAAAAAVTALTEYGYVNDGAYAMRLARGYAEAAFGPVRISAQLRRRGFPADTVSETLAALEDDFDYSESIRRTAEKKTGGDVGGLSYEQRAKLSAFLARRGFTYEQINGILLGR